MGNLSQVSGFTAVGYLNGANWDGKGRLYYIDSTDTNVYLAGDPVTLAAGLDTKHGMPSLGLGAAGATCVGVLLAVGPISSTTPGGPLINPNNLTLTSAPAVKNGVSYYGLVADDPLTIFEVQEGGTGALFTYAAATKNANFALGTRTGTLYASPAFLDNGTAAATTATYNCKLLGLSQKADNTFGTFQKWRVLINNHYYRAGTAGV